MLKAACWAPSPANSQPWEFVIITKTDSRERLRQLSEKAREAGTVEVRGYLPVRPLPYTELEAREHEQALAEGFRRYPLDFLTTVPVVVAVVGLRQPRIRQVLPRERIEDGYKFACAAAIQNMLLAAHAEGLAALWFTFFDQKLVYQFLKLTGDKEVIALVCVGYPARKISSPGRYPVKSKVRRFD